MGYATTVAQTQRIMATRQRKLIPREWQCWQWRRADRSCRLQVPASIPPRRPQCTQTPLSTSTTRKQPLCHTFLRWSCACHCKTRSYNINFIFNLIFLNFSPHTFFSLKSISTLGYLLGKGSNGCLAFARLTSTVTAYSSRLFPLTTSFKQSHIVYSYFMCLLKRSHTGNTASVERNISQLFSFSFKTFRKPVKYTQNNSQQILCCNIDISLLALEHFESLTQKIWSLVLLHRMCQTIPCPASWRHGRTVSECVQLDVRPPTSTRKWRCNCRLVMHTPRLRNSL